MPFQLVKLVDPIQITVVGGLSNGVNNGDIIRWNSISGGWESVSEPFELEEIHKDFSWGDVSSSVITTMRSGLLIRSIYFIVQNAFDGIGAEITIGTVADPDLLLKTTDVDLKTIGNYLISPGYKFFVDTEIKIFNTLS